MCSIFEYILGFVIESPSTQYVIGSPDGVLVQAKCASEVTSSSKFLTKDIICALKWCQGKEILTL